jgi:hypothetical protein
LNSRIISIFLITITLLIGCAKEETFEDYFHAKMKEMHIGEKDYSYSLVHTEINILQQDDAIAVFKEHNQQAEQIFIAYIKKEHGKWNWKHTRGAEWDSQVVWSSMHQVPYIYSGAISDNSISEVYAGDLSAKIIDVEGNKRFWYAISNVKDVEVKFVREDGTEETMEEIDEEVLKDWGE